MRVDLRLGGDLAPESQAAESKQDSSQPIGLTGRLDYRQHPLADGRVVRQYSTAETALTGGLTRSLRPEHRLIVVEPTPAGPRAFSAAGPLFRSEVDLLQIAADPLAIDGLLPTQPVAEGETWSLDPAHAAALLVLDKTTICDVASVLTDVSSSHARFRFAGTVHGYSDGAETQIDLRGVALFDRRTRRITKLNLALQARRETGPATPALDAGMKINLSMRPASMVEHIADDTIQQTIGAKPDTRIIVESDRGDWSLLTDRNWFVVGSNPASTTLRRVDGDRVAAFATIRPLRRNQLPSVAELEKEVRYTLGERMSRVLGSGAWTTREGLRCVALAAEGQRGDGSSAEWRHFVAGSEGRTAAVAITTPIVNDRAAEPVGRALIESLRFTQKVSSADRSTSKRR